jgi:hypothetical protein
MTRRPNESRFSLPALREARKYNTNHRGHEEHEVSEFKYFKRFVSLVRFFEIGLDRNIG